MMRKNMKRPDFVDTTKGHFRYEFKKSDFQVHGIYDDSVYNGDSHRTPVHCGDDSIGLFSPRPMDTNRNIYTLNGGLNARTAHPHDINDVFSPRNTTTFHTTSDHSDETPACYPHRLDTSSTPKSFEF